MQSPSYLSVVEAIPLIRSSLGSLSYEEEFTVCFVKEPNSSEESARVLLTCEAARRARHHARRARHRNFLNFYT